MSVQIAPRLLASADLGISDMRRAIFFFSVEGFTRHVLSCCSLTGLLSLRAFVMKSVMA